MALIALVGNPNSGKSSLFNALTGTRQKVANYPGITVDVKTGKLTRVNGEDLTLLDMPGLYSAFPVSEDGRLVMDVLLDKNHIHHPDVILYVVDAMQIEAQMMLFTQLADMGFRMALVVNMIDSPGYDIDYEALGHKLGVPVIPVSSRTGENIALIHEAIPELLYQDTSAREVMYHPDDLVGPVQDRLREHDNGTMDYLSYIRATQQMLKQELPPDTRRKVLAAQVAETMARSGQIRKLLAGVVRSIGGSDLSGRIDRIVTHWLAGPCIFGAIMVLVFQAIFAWATYPMDAIEWLFAHASQWVHTVLGDGWLPSFLADGLLAGLSGVLMFVPQIAILFCLIAILEESGYMARAVFLFDRLLQRFGMNGRSVVSLISGGACAIPAIMSTRTIENRRERLITILVTPFISCSARIPVFTVLVAFVVPYHQVWGIFNSQGLVFTGLYILGIVTALGAAWVFKQILKTGDPSFLILELPRYRMPDWINVWTEVKSKAGAFIREAGKIIVLISLVLWFLSSFGPTGAMHEAARMAEEKALANGMSPEETDNLVAAYKLEASFAGILGKTFEPVIAPLGFDWKIGIALITSFAAREVFVGSMATIYSVGSDVDEFRLREFLSGVTNPDTGKQVFDMATSLSLIFFYLFALQCMSTLAVVRKETGTWKWPLIQFFFMGALAYLASLAVYQSLS